MTSAPVFLDDQGNKEPWIGYNIYDGPDRSFIESGARKGVPLEKTAAVDLTQAAVANMGTHIFYDHKDISWGRVYFNDTGFLVMLNTEAVRSLFAGEGVYRQSEEVLEIAHSVYDEYFGGEVANEVKTALHEILHYQSELK
jgi:hypothetical protein